MCSRRTGDHVHKHFRYVYTFWLGIRAWDFWIREFLEDMQHFALTPKKALECAHWPKVVQQFYGAGQLKLVGVVLQRTLVICTAASIPVYLLWAFTAPLLRLMDIEPELCDEVAIFVQVMAAGLLPAYVFDCLRKYLQVCAPVKFLLHADVRKGLEYKFRHASKTVTACSDLCVCVRMYGYMWHTFELNVRAKVQHSFGIRFTHSVRNHTPRAIIHKQCVCTRMGS